jgi:hypothetical protein
MSFPTITGSNLRRQKLSLPQDFEGRYNLIFVAFQQWQQMEVNTWVPLAEKLEEQFPGLVYYELPTIRSLNTLSRFFINEGMRAGIPDPKSRERTITIYLDKEEFRKALAIPDEDHIYVLLFDNQGEELWRASGPHSQKYEEDLLIALRQFTKQP